MMQQLGLSTFSSALLLGLLITSPVINAEDDHHDHHEHSHDHAHDDHTHHVHEEPAKKEHDHAHHDHDHSNEAASKSAADKQDSHDHAHNETRTQHGTHEHGTAQLMVSLSEQQLDIVLETPAANLLGFEHTPKTKEQNEHLVAIQQRLKQVDGLLIPASTAKCTLKDYKSESPLFTERASTKDQQLADQVVHNDISVTWQWQCSDMKQLDQVEVKLFSAFPQGFQRLNVEWISANNASAVRLTSDDKVMFK
ncbi:MAG: ZrgA family zinc uptake protein, partial [bacterium]